MARPRSFDETTALDAAMNLFWARGYEGTGLADLLEVMGIQRGSLYKAWGSKAALFQAVLQRYDALHVTPGVDLLEGADSGMSGEARIACVFETSDPRGCLMCSTAAGVAGTDPKVAAWVRDRLNRLRAAFSVALRDGADPGTDVAVRADELTQRYVGMRVRQRTDGGRA